MRPAVTARSDRRRRQEARLELCQDPGGDADPRAGSSGVSMRLAIFTDVYGQVGRLPGWLCAHGHTHQAALWIGRGDGTIERQRRPTSQRLGRSMRAVACPGALSGPDPSWLLVDTVRRRLTWHRISTGST